MGRIRDWYGGLTQAGKIGFTSLALVFGLGTVGSLALSPPSTTKPSGQQSAVKQARIEIKQVTSTEVIPFTTTTVNDANLDVGQTSVQTEGVDGVLSHTYKVTYTDGIETSRSAAIDSITIQPVTKVVVQGTRQPAPSCPNGTYVNSYGSTVCRPYESSSTPAGASARCVDGTYSFSQTRRGTCSHHGGVAVWY